MADIKWFYTKSKVAICLAITDSFHFLNRLKDGGILSEEEALELQGDTRNVHRVVYECLCLIEEKDVSAEHFLQFLFQKSFLKKYPDLNSVCAEYKEGKYRNGIHSTADKDKDPQIFAQDKVRLCLTITYRFPFLHGLQDLAVLSESESLKLQADERPVPRVIYESLSLIEKKDMKLNIVFEYIFQQCYLKLYPGLQDILRESSVELVGPFNGEMYPKFRIPTDLVECFDHNKTYISEAVNERFPFLHGLHDLRLLSYLQLLKLQADRRSTKEVLYEALSHIQTIRDKKSFFAYVGQEFYRKLYPDLQLILQMLVKNQNCEISDQRSRTPSQDETREAQEQDSKEPSSENPKWHKYGKRKACKTNSFALSKSSSDERPDPVQVTRPMCISPEFPKQVYNEKFKVRCGYKTGIFKKKHWKGDSSKDLCIHSEGKKFSVIAFERYGGKEASKNWKKSILCEKIKLENLIEAEILEQSIWTKKHK